MRRGKPPGGGTPLQPGAIATSGAMEGASKVKAEDLEAHPTIDLQKSPLVEADPSTVLGSLLGARGAPAAASTTSDPAAGDGDLTRTHVPNPPAGAPTQRNIAAIAAPLPERGEKPKVWVATHKPAQDPDPRLILLRDPDSERAASFRILRHRLAERGDPRIIAVSSASAGEGKTTCAVNLAMALSECGRAKVLLVEANLRTPSLAALFGFLPPECFSAQLTRHRDRPLEPWSIVEAFSPHLHVAAVKPGEAARPLLDAPSFAIAMEMLARAGYDYIVVDTPPVLGSADVNLIEDSCDGVLLAVRARTTTGRALRRAVDQLSPAKILGAALLDA
jgi:Mrp family chromosome partitioning ATPase